MNAFDPVGNLRDSHVHQNGREGKGRFLVYMVIFLNNLQHRFKGKAG